MTERKSTWTFFPKSEYLKYRPEKKAYEMKTCKEKACKTAFFYMDDILEHLDKIEDGLEKVARGDKSAITDVMKDFDLLLSSKNYLDGMEFGLKLGLKEAGKVVPEEVENVFKALSSMGSLLYRIHMDIREAQYLCAPCPKPDGNDLRRRETYSRPARAGATGPSAWRPAGLSASSSSSGGLGR